MIILWNEFSNEIKLENRYFVDNVDFSKLIIYIETLVANYDYNNTFYRSRIQKDGENIGIKSMGAPPPNKAVSGRINPEGISNLYLSDNMSNSISEIRPGFLDVVKVAEFQPNQEIKIIDLTLINTISPFSFGSISETYLDYYINMRHLKYFEEDLLKPVKRSDVPLEYIPTQYICEYIKNLDMTGLSIEVQLTTGIII